MGLRERFRRDDELDGDGSTEQDSTVEGVEIRVGEEQPDPTYTPAATPPPELASIEAPAPVVDAPAVDAAPVVPTSPVEREALVQPRLAPWQSAALGSKKDVDEDKLFEEAGLSRFERKAAPHLQAPPKIASSAPPPTAPPPAAPPAPAVTDVPFVELDAADDAATAAAAEAAELEVDLSDDEEDEDSDRALARRASKLLERGDLSPDDPEVIHLLEVVNSSGERARPGELVDLNKLDPSERTRLIIRVLCGLVAELPTGESGPVEELEQAEAAATA